MPKKKKIPVEEEKIVEKPRSKSRSKKKDKDDDKERHRSKSKKKDKDKKKHKSSRKELTSEDRTPPAFGSIVSSQLKEKTKPDDAKSNRSKSRKSQPSQRELSRPITDEENKMKEVKLSFPSIEQKTPDISGKIINIKQKRLDIIKRNLLMINYQTPE